MNVETDNRSFCRRGAVWRVVLALYAGTLIGCGAPRVAECRHGKEAPARSRAGDPQLLSSQNKARCLAILRQGLQSEEFWPSIHAAEALTRAGLGAEVLPVLKSRMETERDDQKRCGLAREMCRAGERAALSILLDMVANSHSHSNAIGHAVESFFKLSETGDVQFMTAARDQEGDIALQVLAAAVLARRGDLPSLALIRQRLTDTRVEARVQAAWVVGQIGDASDIPRLLQQVRTETDPVTKSYLFHALASLGDPTGWEALVRNLQNPDPDIRAGAAECAGRCKGVVPERLIPLLDDPVLDVRIRAAQSLLVGK